MTTFEENGHDRNQENLDRDQKRIVIAMEEITQGAAAGPSFGLCRYQEARETPRCWQATATPVVGISSAIALKTISFPDRLAAPRAKLLFFERQ